MSDPVIRNPDLELYRVVLEIHAWAYVEVNAISEHEAVADAVSMWSYSGLQDGIVTHSYIDPGNGRLRQAKGRAK